MDHRAGPRLHGRHHHRRKRCLLSFECRPWHAQQATSCTRSLLVPCVALQPGCWCETWRGRQSDVVPAAAACVDGVVTGSWAHMATYADDGFRSIDVTFKITSADRAGAGSGRKDNIELHTARNVLDGTLQMP